MELKLNMSTSVASLTRRAFVSGLALATFPSTVIGQTRDFQPTRYARGAKVPRQLQNHIKAQNAASKARDKILRADPNYMKALSTANPRILSPKKDLPSRFDWRDFDQVTGVRNQGQCGSCWIFAAIGAHEAAHLIATQKTYTRLPLHVSEQQVLDCSFSETNCVVGGWHEVVLLYLQLKGLVADDQYPYHPDFPTRGACVSDFGARPYYVANWGYVEIGASANPMIASDYALKQAIQAYGPLTSAVATANWDFYRKTNPNWEKDYPDAIFNGEPSEKLRTSDVNHEVLIVGWDDSRGVRIIKNSWGTDWGDAGYINLRYGTNYIGFAACWVLALLPDTAKYLGQKLETVTRKNELLKFYPQVRQLQ